MWHWLTPRSWQCTAHQHVLLTKAMSVSETAALQKDGTGDRHSCTQHDYQLSALPPAMSFTLGSGTNSAVTHQPSHFSSLPLASAQSPSRSSGPSPYWPMTTTLRFADTTCTVVFSLLSFKGIISQPKSGGFFCVVFVFWFGLRQPHL